MNLSLLTAELGKIKGLSYVYGYFPDNVELPYVAYHTTEENPVFADGHKIYSDEQVELILVTAKRDLSLERALDEMFNVHGITTDKSMEFDEDQKIHIVTYNFTVD